jgi:DNA-binding LacI/PurR family transcriptional regulator
MERINGYRRALADRGIKPDPLLERIGEESPDSGYLITQELLRLSEKPSLLFVATNYHLIGCLRAIHDAGLQIPSDISVICFDDPEWSPYLNPPLTAVRPDTDALCATAVHFLLERVEERYSGDFRCQVVPTSFIPRSSVASR